MPREPLEVRVVESPKSLLARVSAWVPIFISLLALGVAINGAMEARRYNRLSAHPSVYFGIMGASSERRIGLNISNTGLGPAVMSDFTVFLDKKKMEKGGNPDWQAVSAQLHDLIGDKGDPEFFWINDGYMMRPGESHLVYTIQPKRTEDDEKFMAIFAERLIVKVRVCSVYGECYERCSGNSAACTSTD